MVEDETESQIMRNICLLLDSEGKRKVTLRISRHLNRLVKFRFTHVSPESLTHLLTEGVKVTGMDMRIREESPLVWIIKDNTQNH